MPFNAAGDTSTQGLPRAASAQSRRSAALVSILVLASGLAAQDAAPAAPVQPPAAPVQPPAAAELTLGTIVPASIKLKCFASPLAAEFDDTLAQGTVVALGRSERGYRQILMPLGPTGYVHKDFTTAPADGKVKSKGTLVSFRYRPKSGEAPTARLEENTELIVVGELPEWWRVHTTAVEAWLPDASVQVAPAVTPELQQGYDATLAAAQQEPQQWLAALQQKHEQEQQAVLARQSLDAVREAIAAEMRKPTSAQDYAMVEQKLTELQQGLPEGSPLLQDIAVEQRRVADRKWVVAAIEATTAVPEPAKDVPQVLPEVQDPLGSFNAIGWLRWERGMSGPGRYLIEKGGRTLYVVTCNNDRYDLALFVNREVALIGPRRRPELEALRVLDIEKIEVLSTAAN